MIPALPIVVCLIVSLAGLLAVALAPHLKAARRGWFLAAAIIATIYGGSKARISFSFVAETGIFDAGSYSDLGAGKIYAVWGYQPYAAGSKFKWFYTYVSGGETKGPIFLPDVPVEACSAEHTLSIPEDDWERLIVTCYTEYVAPPTVVTNGVYHLSGVMRSINDAEVENPRYVTPMIEIRLDDRILTPTNKPPAAATASDLKTITEEEE